MPTLVRRSQTESATTAAIAEDKWLRLDEAPDTVVPGTIVPFEAVDDIGEVDNVGVWIDGDFEVEDHVEALLQRPLIAVRFPAFADGRALSIAALLRRRFGYEGELRAFGDVLPDWTPYMARSGFDTFELASERDAEVAISCMARITDHYQASVVEPRPAFRRHSLG